MCQPSNSDIIAFSSVAIALLAMLATFWQAKIAREHNKLSVRPFVEHSQSRLHGGHISISISNHGLGPAFITNLRLIHDSFEKPLNIVEYLDWVFEHIQLKDVDYEGTNITDETVVSSNKIITIFEFKLLDNQEHQFLFISEILDKTLIHINYRCVYGKTYSYHAPLTIA